MTAIAQPVDHVAQVFARVQRVLSPVDLAEDVTVDVLTRFLTGREPAWLSARSDAVRLDVLTVHGVLAHQRNQLT